MSLYKRIKAAILAVTAALIRLYRLILPPVNIVSFGRKTFTPSKNVFPSYYIYVEIRKKRSNRLTERNQKT